MINLLPIFSTRNLKRDGQKLNPTSIDEQGIDSLEVYPNPASAYIDICNPTSQICNVELHDVNGHLLKLVNLEANAETRITLEGIPSGMFVLVFTSPDHQLYRKHIISKY